MKYKIFIVTLFNIFFSNAQKTNLAISKPVSDVYFGDTIVDEYRNLEDLKNPQTINWMKSQSDYSNSILSNISNRNYYLDKRLELDKRQGYTISNLRITGNDKYFYLKKLANEKIEKVYYRDGFNGKEYLMYDPTKFHPTKKNGEFVVNLISPSWDGSHIAISMSEKGKEFSEVIVLNVKNKNIYPGIITNTDPSNIGGITWLDDNSGFFYIYYPDIDINSKTFRRNTKSVLYKIGKNPKILDDVFSSLNNPNLDIANDKYPAILSFNADDEYFIGMLVDSEDYRRAFKIKKEDLLKGNKNWEILYDKDSKVSFIRVVGEEIIFLSGYNSPNYKLCKTNIKNPDFKNPQILVPEKKDEVFKNYVITKDGIYYTTTKNGVEARLYLYKDNKETSISLPYTSGNVNLQSKGKNFHDVWVSCSGWANMEQRFKYSFQQQIFISENLAPVIDYPEFKDIIVEETTVKSYDGAEVPLSLIYNKNLKKNSSAPVMIEGYGAYGQSYYPFFARSYLVWANQGGVFAIAHVRGGGEKGEQWHIDGKKNNKPNSWKDLIACSEYLINEKFTAKKKIALWGASAGGILIGRSMTERPDLFGAVIIEAGVLNSLRNELGGVGSTSTEEFGSVTNKEDFKALLEMDAYHHIQNEKNYPASLITIGINDSKVTAWQSTKFVAKLLNSKNSKNSTLLKIDYDGGHGADVPVKKLYANVSDTFAFAFWQLGHPDYQPKEK